MFLKGIEKKTVVRFSSRATLKKEKVMFGDKTMEAFTPSEVGEDELLVQGCSECGSDFVGAGFPIGVEGCWISAPNCGNCYGYVDGVYKG